MSGDERGDGYRSGLNDDDGELARLVAEHLPWIERQVHQRMGAVVREDGDTGDVLQEALLEVLRYGPSFRTRDRDRFRGLLLRIVENNLRDRYRRLHRGVRDRRRHAGPASDSMLELDPAVRSITSPSVAAARREHEEWLRLAVELLEPADRDVLRLRDWQQLEFAEIGSALGVSAEAARKRYHRALPRLADKVLQLRRGRG
ncbi:MAG: sigma-70 family RNA polymerase sigma factor [Planctomycetes bacterium]|nr:sigma-70 family RNA polymerase sigma factor [Planctomycetota bacterium]